MLPPIIHLKKTTVFSQQWWRDKRILWKNVGKQKHKRLTLLNFCSNITLGTVPQFCSTVYLKIISMEDEIIAPVLYCSSIIIRCAVLWYFVILQTHESFTPIRLPGLCFVVSVVLKETRPTNAEAWLFSVYKHFWVVFFSLPSSLRHRLLPRPPASRLGGRGTCPSWGSSAPRFREFYHFGPVTVLSSLIPHQQADR